MFSRVCLEAEVRQYPDSGSGYPGSSPGLPAKSFQWVSLDVRSEHASRLRNVSILSGEIRFELPGSVLEVTP